jgi:hypothetical protein
MPKIYSRLQGRPQYDLDTDHLIQLHNLGNSWSAVADAVGVSRWTIYYHLTCAGIITTRPAFTAIDDDDLDELVAQISLAHPFVGSVIVRGHLESLGVHVPSSQVQESLQQVDAIGVLGRCILIKNTKLLYEI